jgi:type VI secretion system lysozyme-like protein
MPVVRHKRGAPVLLFDRLIPRGQAGDHRLRSARMGWREVYDRRQLEASIAEQLAWLLNTRVPISYAEMEVRTREGRRTTLDYGLPDLTVYRVDDASRTARLARHIAETIAIYEPRLGNPQVQLRPREGRSDVLVAEIGGEMKLGNVAVPVSFQFPMQFEGPRHGH